MTEIILVRHGETELNTAGVFRGRADVALNDRGVAQAQAVADALSSDPVVAVYSSPMVRALDTARAVASRHGLEPAVDPAFDNIDLGEWQGVEKELVRQEHQ
jgi:broad specificity phosphatase PhoE